MRGPKPKPAAIKKMAGNPGKRPLNKNEPEPVPGIPIPPDFLGETARQEWGAIIQDLTDAKVLSLVDRAMIAGYCQAFEMVSVSRSEIKANGEFFENRFNERKVNPAVNTLHKFLGMMRTYLAEFGLSPSARARVKIDTATNPEANPDRQAAQIIGF